MLPIYLLKHRYYIDVWEIISVEYRYTSLNIGIIPALNSNIGIVSSVWDIMPV